MCGRRVIKGEMLGLFSVEGGTGNDSTQAK